ncbi:hypothetical protein C0989_002135, partial [Termitomyces sp. Mn162]
LLAHSQCNLALDASAFCTWAQPVEEPPTPPKPPAALTGQDLPNDSLILEESDTHSKHMLSYINKAPTLQFQEQAISERITPPT